MFRKNKKLGAGKVKALATKPKHLSLIIPLTHINRRKPLKAT